MAQKLDAYINVKGETMLRFINDFKTVENYHTKNGYQMVGILEIDNQIIMLMSEITTRPYDIEQYREILDYDKPIDPTYY